MYDTILVPTDGSAEFDRVTEHAADLAGRYDATVHALYVADERITEGVPEEAMEAVATALEDEGAGATESVESVLEEAGVPVERVIDAGVPHDAILTYAVEESVDLIVMGTHGATGPERGNIGSVAERVVRRSTVPVHVVPMVDADASRGPAGYRVI
ncbi:MAG: universal stress protein [Halodesulfurarchaeum sp.]